MIEQIYIYIYICINTLRMGKTLAPQGLTLKNNSKLKWKCLKQKFKFYHVQVNIQVRLTLRFLQVSQQQQQHLLSKYGGF